MKKQFSFLTTSVLLIALSMFTQAHASGNDLVGMLSGKLGVTEAQAKGGAGAIFDYAKGQLSVDDFGTVSNALPIVSGLIGSKPEASSEKGSLGGALGSMGSALGGSKGTTTLGVVSALGGAFSSLGLDADMVTKFIPIILQYARLEGGAKVMQLLSGALQ